MRSSFRILSVIVFILIINFVISSPNHERDRGDPCVQKDSQRGICKEIKECDYAKELYKKKKTSEILSYRCKFLGNQPLVCCPLTSPVRINEEETTVEIEESTDQISTQNCKNSGKTKFQKALCENVIPEVGVYKNILGGVEAGVGEFPYIAAIGYRKMSERDSKDPNTIKYLCGGSLIADDIVITAAHCLNKNNVIPKVVKLGRTSLVPDEDDYSDGDDIEIEYFKIHPSYSQGSKHNDIALMKLKRPYNISSGFINPVCLSRGLPINDKDMPQNFTIAGFGINDFNTKKTSDWLLKAIVNEYPFQKCREIISEAFLNKVELIDSQLCALGYKGADSCQGDSGGPLSYDVSFTGATLTYLYAVVSTGIGCGSAVPGIYTKVDKYLDWIEREMNLMEQC